MYAQKAYQLGGRGWGVLNKLLNREAPLQGPTPIYIPLFT